MHASHCIFRLAFGVMIIGGCAPAGIDDSQVEAEQVPYLGIMPDYAARDMSKGVKIAGVLNGSPAKDAGLNSGDVILQLSGKKITGVRDWFSEVAQLEIGHPIELVVRSGDRERVVTVIPRARSTTTHGSGER